MVGACACSSMITFIQVLACIALISLAFLLPLMVTECLKLWRNRNQPPPAGQSSNYASDFSTAIAPMSKETMEREQRHALHIALKAQQQLNTRQQSPSNVRRSKSKGKHADLNLIAKAVEVNFINKTQKSSSRSGRTSKKKKKDTKKTSKSMSKSKRAKTASPAPKPRS